MTNQYDPHSRRKYEISTAVRLVGISASEIAFGLSHGFVSTTEIESVDRKNIINRKIKVETFWKYVAVSSALAGQLSVEEIFLDVDQSADDFGYPEDMYEIISIMRTDKESTKSAHLERIRCYIRNLENILKVGVELL